VSALSDLALIFAAGFGSVFLLGFQSRNVNHGNYGWAACTSFLIAMMQTTLWGQLFANLTLISAAVYGLSGACGITLSMWTHKRLIAGKKKP
jgi:hypothetical protein